jgi:2-oxoglutarate ferredoxin oxidoreductase subunit alpha
VAEAVARLKNARMVHLSELWPFPQDAVPRALAGVQKLIVVEGNAAGQLAQLLRRETGLTADHLILRYDGLPFTPEYILRHLPGEA